MLSLAKPVAAAEWNRETVAAPGDKELQLSFIVLTTGCLLHARLVLAVSLFLGFDDLAEEFHLERAMRWLREGQVEPAVAAYKSFMSRSPRLVLRAATNLSFIFLLENDVKQAAAYADMAVEADRLAFLCDHYLHIYIYKYMGAYIDK